jgi:hypothetical protein
MAKTGSKKARKKSVRSKPVAHPDIAKHPWTEVPRPVTRSLRVYAVDPSAGMYLGNRMTLEVPWEDLSPGPVGEKIAVVDYDPAHDCYYPPVDLNDKFILARRGLDPTEADPRFHQQMVYAVASRVIEMFEVALGRSIHWRREDKHNPPPPRADWQKSGDIRVLNLYPHAMQAANAYYSPEAHGILFGYFTANTSGQGANLPGQRVFTCLSHDIIAHEVTHAVIDGIRTYFTEPTNPDVLAFHEGFADLCALFSHFSNTEALMETIRRTGGKLYEPELEPVARGGERPRLVLEQRPQNPLIQLALQFGQARGEKGGLRSALGTDAILDDRQRDPHARGSILVAAVFDAYFTVYMRGAGELIRIYHAGGAPQTEDLPDLLAKYLCRHAADLATLFFKLCAGALDYCPPVDVTFGDFLRALITVSTENQPDDRQGIRSALLQAFRLRNIYPHGAGFLSEEAVCWPVVANDELPPVKAVIEHPVTGEEYEAWLQFGNGNGLTKFEKDVNGRVLRAYAQRNRRKLGLDPDLPASIPSFHAVCRVLENGRLHVEMVIEVMQLRPAQLDPHAPQLGAFPFRGGVTMIVEAPRLVPLAGGGMKAEPPEVRRLIGRAIDGDEGRRREQAQRAYALSLGLAQGDANDPRHFQADFGLVHEERLT